MTATILLSVSIGILIAVPLLVKITTLFIVGCRDAGPELQYRHPQPDHEIVVETAKYKSQSCICATKPGLLQVWTASHHPGHSHEHYRDYKTYLAAVVNESE